MKKVIMASVCSILLSAPMFSMAAQPPIEFTVKAGDSCYWLVQNVIGPKCGFDKIQYIGGDRAGMRDAWCEYKGGWVGNLVAGKVGYYICS